MMGFASCCQKLLVCTTRHYNKQLGWINLSYLLLVDLYHRTSRLKVD